MMTVAEISSMTNKDWMPASKKPAVHKWLQPEMDEKTQSRLKVAGNVVIPQMAWVAANMLAKMSRWNPLEDTGFEY